MLLKMCKALEKKEVERDRFDGSEQEEAEEVQASRRRARLLTEATIQ